MKTVRKLLFFILILIAAGPGAVSVNAEGTGHWAADQRIPGYLDDTFPPFLVPDHNRTVHAFVSQWVEKPTRRLAIVYRQWTLQGGWTRPLDVVVASSGDANILGAYLDAVDNLHVIFGMGPQYEKAVYHTFAPAINADSASAWSLPEMIGYGLGLSSAGITGDDAGNLVVIYCGNLAGNGVYATTSSDWGVTWSKPETVYLTLDSDLTPFSLRIFPGPDRQVRAAWNVVTSLGEDKLLYFANFNIPQSKWSEPTELDRKIEIMDYFGPSYPALADTGSEIVIMYNMGNPVKGRPVKLGRPVQAVLTSRDNGETWNGPSVPFASYQGRSGEHAMVVDGSGVPHALFVQRIDGTNEKGQYMAIGGLWHSAYQNGNWTSLERYVTTITPHDVRAVVSQGNVLLVVWREDPGVGQHGVWFSYVTLDTPELPVVPLKAAEPVVISQPSPSALPPTATLTPLPENILDDKSPSPWSENPAFPLLVGILPVILIVIGLLAAYRFLVNQR